MSKFHGIELYKPSQSSVYTLLPLRFSPLDQDHYVLTNLAGEYLRLKRGILHEFLHHKLSNDDPNYIELRARHFLIDDSSSIAPELFGAQAQNEIFSAERVHRATSLCCHAEMRT